jgi:enediyne biosynthesis protein E3
MAVGWRAVRRRVLTPNVSATSLRVRGFYEKDVATRQLLEEVGRTFLAGFAAAAGARGSVEAGPELEAVPAQFRGFAYEGAAMAFTLLDALPVPGRGRLAEFLAGTGSPHVYMAYVGAGWALARLPRPLWTRVTVPDPLLRWLALDGYGFHQAYFRTDAYVRRQHRTAGPDRPVGGPAAYRARVVDQGVGRALWFVCGADVECVLATIRGFAPSRQSDLFSGAGLAATYAGGAGEAELQRLRGAAGEHRAALAQGSAFAAKARLRAGLVAPHTAIATEVFCAMDPETAAKVTDDALPPDADPPFPGGAGGSPVEAQVPAYERWRRRIADVFAERTQR